MNPLHRNARRVASALVLSAAFVGLAAAPAQAAPAFEVELSAQRSEVQLVIVRADVSPSATGTYRLNFGSGGPGISETGDLKAAVNETNPAAAEVQSALNSLANINAGGGSVSVESFARGWYAISFDGGPLAGTDVPQLTVAPGSIPLSSGIERVQVLTAYTAGISRSDKRVNYALKVRNTGPDSTSGTTSAEVVLPAGSKASLLGASGSGWTCSTSASLPGEAAKATCTSSGAIASGGSFPTLTVGAGPSADSPDSPLAYAIVSGGGAAAASDEEEFQFGPAKPFGLESIDTEVAGPEGTDFTQAGGHPLAGSLSAIPFVSRTVPGQFATKGPIRTILTNLPRGFVGNALAVPELCPTLAEVLASTCPPGSAVGGLSVDVTFGTGEFGNLEMTIYAIEPEFGAPAQFAFAELSALNTTYTLTPKLRADEGYAIRLDATPSPTTPPIRRINYATLCNFGAELSEGKFVSCKRASDPDANPLPLITTPTRCSGTPPTTEVLIDSWANPGLFTGAQTTDPTPTGCDQVEFTPDVEVEPTSARADSPTGLDMEITMPTDGLEDPEGVAQAHLKRTRITFPQGMGINAAAGQGLGSCSAAQIRLGTNEPASCPESSKIGTIEIETPIIRGTLRGDVFIAEQDDPRTSEPGAENPFDAMIGLYLVFESKRDGILIKIPGRVEPNPRTGQLVAIFDEILEDPFSRVAVHFGQGPRATLITPPRCGTHEIKAEFSPWSAVDPDNPSAAEIVTQTSTFEVTEGPNGGPCPDGALRPKLSAGATNPTAGQHTGFQMALSREDGTERLSGLELSLPPGMLGKLKGVPYCPEAAIQAALNRSGPGEGQDEIDSPSCPQASRLGSVSAGAGAGPNPLYVNTGSAYLAGPYKGAPLSLVVIAPAVAGPLDLGTVVIRNQLRIDRRSAQITAISDPVPTILHGVLLDIRDVRLSVERPGFILNPTSCEAMALAGQVSGESGTTAPISDRFQLGGCEALGFKPRLSIHLKGGTRRGDHPALVATLRARPGDANVARAAVTLPRSAFLDQSHIRTICTRVQFAAESCPPGAVYGSTEATTPLLEETLKGAVVMRSSDNKLPDLVGTLKGIATVDVVGRIDSVNGGIRNTFDLVPDAPVERFVLRMRGGKKGLVVNSRNLCSKLSRATVRLTAHNGRHYNYRPVVVAEGCRKARKKAARPKGRAKGSR